MTEGPKHSEGSEVKGGDKDTDRTEREAEVTSGGRYGPCHIPSLHHIIGIIITLLYPFITYPFTIPYYTLVTLSLPCLYPSHTLRLSLTHVTYAARHVRSLPYVISLHSFRVA